MPVALVLLGASVFAPNPLSIALVPGTLDPGRPRAVAVTRAAYGTLYASTRRISQVRPDEPDDVVLVNSSKPKINSRE